MGSLPPESLHSATISGFAKRVQCADQPYAAFERRANLEQLFQFLFPYCATQNNYPEGRNGYGFGDRRPE
jgi:hypothetical protein